MFDRFRRSSASITDVQNADLTTAGIPKLIHVIWIGGKAFPYEDNFRTWKKHNPGYQVRLWTDKNLPPLRSQWVLDALAETPGMPIAVRADIIRLELLARYGGIYTDADSWCLKPLAPLLDTPTDPFTLEPAPALTLFGMTGSKGNVQNATLGAVPRHPAFRLIRDGIGPRYMRLQSLERNTTPGYEIFDLFGTRYITRILRGFPDFFQVDRGQLKGSRELICVQGQDDTTNAYIVHANAVSWKKTGTANRFTLQPAHPIV